MKTIMDYVAEHLHAHGATSVATAIRCDAIAEAIGRESGKVRHTVYRTDCFGHTKRGGRAFAYLVKPLDQIRVRRVTRDTLPAVLGYLSSVGAVSKARAVTKQALMRAIGMGGVTIDALLKQHTTDLNSGRYRKKGARHAALFIWSETAEDLSKPEPKAAPWRELVVRPHPNPRYSPRGATPLPGCTGPEKGLVPDSWSRNFDDNII